MSLSPNIQIPLKDSQQSGYYLLLFILWPFLACITALANFHSKEARTVVYMFLIYYGFTFVIGSEGIDASRSAMILETNAQLPFSDIFKIIGGIYASETSIDIIEPLITFVVSRVTNDHRFLFGAYAALFGFFYVKSISLLSEKYIENPGWNGLIHILFFAFILPITSINGFRMWTAAWIFFYGAYHVILYGKARYLILTLAASAVHFSFLAANAVLLIYYFVGNRNLIYFPLLILSLVLPTSLEPLLRSSLGLFGSAALKARVEMYTDESYILARQESFEEVSWFMKIGSDLVLYYLIFAIIVIQIIRRLSYKAQPERNLFSFLLLFLAFVNFGMPIPSLGGRFLIVFFMLATLYVFMNLNKIDSKRVELITLLGLFPMVLFAAITFRQGSETMNAWIFSPGLGIPWIMPELTVYDVLFR